MKGRTSVLQQLREHEVGLCLSDASGAEGSCEIAATTPMMSIGEILVKRRKAQAESSAELV
jgi:hypothetical protein